MPSKKSKPTRKAQPQSPRASQASRAQQTKHTPKQASKLLAQKVSPLVWKEERGFSEQDLSGLAQSLAKELAVGDRVLLEGQMGAGKTTFSRHLLLALGVEQPPEGSPTFAIAHEYALPSSARGDRRILGVVHVDLYRIRSEEEIDERGIPDYFWDSEKIVLSEWTSMWPEFERQVLKSGHNWKVELTISEESSDLRDIKITRPDRRSSAR